MQQPAAPTKRVPENWRTGLAIVAHPDDLEYGGAAAVAKWTSQGKKITYVMVSNGEAGIDGMEPSEVGRLRAQEEINAARVVGVEEVEFLDYTDGVIEYGPALASRFEPDDQAAPARRVDHDQPSPPVFQRTSEYGGSPLGGTGGVRCSP